MSEPLLKKRLHISGLTPSIMPADLERRLSSFGRVKTMDGFGARDALGDPKRFGFVTMEISAKELAKCLNVLSGSMWKGAKLRIGEARPDFRERLAQFNSQPPRPIRPKRTRARDYGHPSSTLPLTPLSVTAAASTPGWIMTPSGRVVRPIRMRPERPLEPTRSELGDPKMKGMGGKVKKRLKPPPVRARRRLIDPTKWDSVYLKGMFLDAIPVLLPASKDALESPSGTKRDTVDEEGEEETDGDTTNSHVFSCFSQNEVGPSQPAPQLDQNRAHANLSSQQSQEASLATPSRIHDTNDSIDVRDEANAALVMLGKMFGDEEDWDGRGSVDEMEDLEDNRAAERGVQVDGEDDIEVVPRDSGEGEGNQITKDEGKGKKLAEVIRFDHDDGVDVEAARDKDVEMEEIGPPISIQVSAQTVEPAPQTDLKALFAPREEASFSLLDHLDLGLDLELDADVLGTNARSGASHENGHLSEPILPISRDIRIPATMLNKKVHSRLTLDSSLPLLFPPTDSLPHPDTPSSDPTATSHQHGTPSCFLFSSATRIRGLYHLPPSITFTRSPQDTSESIRERWEKDKSSLTHEWKKAWREARGARRGRVGTGGEVGGGY